MRHLFLSAGTAWLILVSGNSASASDAYVFEQVSRSTGGCVVTVNDSGIKVVSSSGSIIMAAAPSWDVYVLNDKVKKYSQTEFANFHGNFGLSQDFLSGSQFSNVKFEEASKPTVVFGLPARTLTQKSEPGVPAMGPLDGRLRYDARARNLVYTVCDRISADKHPGKLICQYDHIPYKGSFPLELKFMDERGRAQIGLSTGNLRKVKISDTFFTVPREYKKVANQREIDLASKDDLLKEMLNGGGTPRR